MSRSSSALLGSLCLLLAVALPFLGGAGLTIVLTKAMIAALFAMGYNLLWGQAGLLSFGHAAFFAFGTCMTIIAMDAADQGAFPFPTPLLPLVGAFAGLMLGLVAGWFATLRSGVAFAMITVAIGELLRSVAERWDAVFGGESGLSGRRVPWGGLGFQTDLDVYFVTLAWLVTSLGVLWWFQRSPLGLVLRGIREQEERVTFLGYDAHAVKTMAVSLSAAFAGLAGGLLAFSDESANAVLFDGHNSAIVLLNTVIGGAGVFLGPALGASLTTFFGYYVGTLTPYWLFYLGLIFIAVVLAAPQGLAGLLRGLPAQCARPGGAARLLARLAGAVLLAAGVVLATEITGRLVAPEYQIVAGQPWPAVPVFGLAWAPLSPLSWGTIIVLLVLGVALLRPPRWRHAAPVATLREKRS